MGKRKTLAPLKPWPAEDDARLAELYPTHSQAQLAAIFGRTEAAINGRCALLGIRKPAGYINPSQFKKGDMPWNTGISYSAGGRSAETRFKPGNRSGSALDRYQPVGAERLTKDGYLQRKVNDDMPLQRRWKMVHVILWEAAHGPLPAAHVVIFKDGDKRNFAPDNLHCISRAENMRRNSFWTNMPREVAQLVQLRGALVRKINRKQKEESRT